MEYYLGVITGVLCGLILVVVMFKFVKNNDNSVKCKYDERQKLVRGIGFKYGFFTLMFYNVAASFLISVEKRQYIDHSALMLIGILCSVFVYAVYCIWNEGYFALNENPKRVVIIFILLAFVNLGVGYRNYLHGLLVEDDMLTIQNINILCGILLLMILPVIAAKHICKKKEE